MNLLISACTYLLIILGSLAGLVAYAAHHDYQSMAEVMADLPDLVITLKLFLCTLVAVVCVLVWEWYRRASREE
ncbi:hypothetical protein [Pseudomonas fluorescens]|uniref:hypothetical protein n=1 Tax=Pseudomonas fluorescens TaxID=294 RepID=UPI0010D37E58|nr:hypothetical protein [Pseudomonas fluorescens]TCV62768.1 hypothetical protein EDB98_11276 [Pseudomonas fluorescens]